MVQNVQRHLPDEYLLSDMDGILASEENAVFMAVVDGTSVGMIEVCLPDYGEGCTTSPVGYIEGWYLSPQLRRQGLAGLLVDAAESGARNLGCTEMASDTWLDNEESIRVHLKLGYSEVECLVHFVKRI